MNRINLLLVVILFVLLVSRGAVQAQENVGGFTIPWYVIGNGGGSSIGGGFTLSGTIGQHDANPESASGGGFELQGGFWYPVLITQEALPEQLYLPLVQRR
jgi:hypothetical protein